MQFVQHIGNKAWQVNGNVMHDFLTEKINLPVCYDWSRVWAYHTIIPFMIKPWFAQSTALVIFNTSTLRHKLDLIGVKLHRQLSSLETAVRNLPLCVRIAHALGY